MVYLIINWVLGILALLGVTIFVPGFRVTDIGSVLIAAGVIGLINATLSLVLNHLGSALSTAVWGALLLIFDTFLFRISGLMVPGFVMTGFAPAVSGGLVLMAVNALALRYAASVIERFEWDTTPLEPEDQAVHTTEVDTTKFVSTNH